MTTEEAQALARAINNGEVKGYHGKAFEVPRHNYGQSVVTAWRVTDRTMRSVVLWEDPRADLPCGCENMECRTGTHVVADDEWTQCPNPATVPVMFVGQQCQPCAEYLPREYWGDNEYWEYVSD